MPSLSDKGPVWADGEWTFPCCPPICSVAPDCIFKVRLNHVVCKEHAIPKSSQRYTPTCVSEIDCWHNGAHAHLFTKRPRSSDGCSCSKKGESEHIGFGAKILDELYQASGSLSKVIQCAACKAQTNKVAILSVYIVLEDEKEPRAATLRHLQLMRERNKADYIQVDFITVCDEENERRLSMVKSLDKLAKKASKHCNR
ncbi:hypothetical protein F5Y03DRAFT_255556 [Xylaria venustula]|nr:hypothetical protein F5Y03DRAFT_255556 [Xylaria venustula]